MRILAIESSCDETAAALVVDGRTVESSVVASQVEEHKLYGGVVPEIASRRHTEAISALTREVLAQGGCSLADVDAVAVTYAPGLIGALLVGVNFAKGLAYSTGKPLIPVHHIRGHIAANYLTYPQLEPPFLCMVVSGGHSHIAFAVDYTTFRILGRTRDDAAGEAFDKAARAMGFPYPGGVHLDRASRQGRADAFRFPRPKLASPYDFSFSGMKTAVINLLHSAEQRGETLDRNDVAASFQDAVTEILTDTIMAAEEEFGCGKLVVAGGVSANSALREKLQMECRKRRCALYLPPLSLCGDNAAMIGAQAYYEYMAGNEADLSLNARATVSLEQG